MDIAIRVMVVLFVTVAVGSLVLMFARKTIDDVQLNMKNLEVKDKQYILELTDVDADDINALVEQCWKDKRQTAVERELCYVIHAPINMFPTDIGPFSFPVTRDFAWGNNALFIYYDIYDDEIEVLQ